MSNIQGRLCADEDPPIDDAFEVFVEEKALLRMKSLSTYAAAIAFFLRVIEEREGHMPRVSGLTPEAIDEYKRVYAAIPSKQPVKGKSVAELLAMKGARKSQATIQNNYKLVAKFIKWLEKEGYPIDADVSEQLK